MSANLIRLFMDLNKHLVLGLIELFYFYFNSSTDPSLVFCHVDEGTILLLVYVDNISVIADESFT